jgi:hypothetical protein
VNVLADGKGGGHLERYLIVEGLRGYLPDDLSGLLVEFTIPGVVNKTVRGMTAETFIDICTAYVRAYNDQALKTDRQIEIAQKASMFLAACSKIGLIAMIDEATGFQYKRPYDALQVKYKLFLAEEIRKWEKTFPDELWKEFARLTRWNGPLHSRPKYWGKLVIELVYEYIDQDVTEWLRVNTPKSRGKDPYHSWLNAQFGLKKLIEHLWMLVGMASACNSMPELREKMAAKFGRKPIQYTMYLPPIDDEPARTSMHKARRIAAKPLTKPGLDAGASSPVGGDLFSEE